MSELGKEIIPVTIEQELKQSYLDYAMSVIVGRALPDVRDGLKPVHRRVLFAMRELSNDWNKPYKKSARIVGDVIGKYHPHGDGPVYDTIVRMAQPFSMRYVLVDGQGNFGSIDGDAAAAMRYTEVRMARIAHEMMMDLEKETVDFSPNYDDSELIPTVLPTRTPNLLINGSSGIAVGMATNIPPHNLTEVIDACVALIDDPNLNLNDLLQHIKGPDFPTAGIINGRAGIIEAYRTGRGRVLIRARTGIENDEHNGKQTIIVTELPYQVNKARLIEKIAELVKEKKIEGITGLRDESDKEGMRIVIELRRGEISEVVLNNLFAQTQLQVVFSINMVCLEEGQPKTLNLKEILDAFLRHRREVVTRRTVFELRKARERAHILEGLGIALTNIDEMIALIKLSANPSEAKKQLLQHTWKSGVVANMLSHTTKESRPEDLDPSFGLLDDQTYRLTEQQAQAILDLRLHRLTGLEQDKILEEYKNLLETIKSLLDILHNESRLLEVIRSEFLAIKEQYGDKRVTEILETQEDLSLEDLITPEEVVITLSHEGYVKLQSLSLYHAQRRGGKGKAATSVKDEDFIEQLIIAHTHDTILCFSNHGKVYWLKSYQVPQASRIARGKPIINLLPLSEGERINALLPVKEYREDQYVFMATEKGTVKKVSLDHFSRPRNSGIIAIELHEGDRLVGVALTDGKQDVMLFSNAGKAIRFPEDKVRSMGRTAAGVRGISLHENQKIISLIIVKEKGNILTATENGYGKCTAIEEYRVTSRGGQGVISIQISERNGNVVGATQVTRGEEVMLITDRGTLIRTRVDEISVVGRNTQGVRLINLSEEEKLTQLQRIADSTDDTGQL
ncbi:MAG: DNA gyrase subunit A [Gammaproteobacteria bacterium RIFCSPLOWO2_02_FULL_38_11]|nr:MAG: DNA gyrase subunit A [Gammaproteobacteria bacterium RIFCSPHIGHO2_12_38_15]OGT67057.1 MAG: DNA gyrase subunit A [Gammaproteobacteria bacterium RIFCSPLOWO2_02_FULL_38_11]OGT76035.1 MAG: DNA gyrase subunit A [Gammaproteobacteria bacterium RIFCSPLOWO2_12_FULL_38_14]